MRAGVTTLYLNLPPYPQLTLRGARSRVQAPQGSLTVKARALCGLLRPCSPSGPVPSLTSPSVINSTPFLPQRQTGVFPERLY